MITDEYVQREILRLVKNNHKSACISTRRISAFYNVPESRIRRQLTTLAEQKKIKLTGWDGHALRPYSEWANAEEFVNSHADGGHFRVELVD
jgi:DeoR/GlpR family transcriptional regulator of sugar metabolism